MRRLALLLTLATLVGLVAASPALGLRTVRSGYKVGSLYLSNLALLYGGGCGVTQSTRIYLGRRVSHVNVRRPQVGARIFSELDGRRVGTLTSVGVIRLPGGGTSVRWVATGGFALCDPEWLGGGEPNVWFRVTFRYRIPKRQMQDCGEMSLYLTRTGLIQANGYVVTCRKARRVAQAWKRHAARCHLSRCPTIITGGYTCHHRRRLNTLYVKCRRGQAILRFWGPDHADAPG